MIYCIMIKGSHLQSLQPARQGIRHTTALLMLLQKERLFLPAQRTVAAQTGSPDMASFFRAAGFSNLKQITRNGWLF